MNGKAKLWPLTALLFVIALWGCSKEEEKPDPLDSARAYADAWQQQQLSGMYAMLTPASQAGMTEEQFAQRYRNIYDGIDAEHLTVSLLPQESPSPSPSPSPSSDKDAAEIEFRYHVEMDTVAGPIAFDHQGKLVETEVGEESKWLIEWSPSLIFPQMEEGDKVRVRTAAAERGEIVDRYGDGLAVNGTGTQLGIVPGKLGDAPGQAKARLAKKLNIGTDEIDKKLSASWVKPDLFVPIAFVADGTEDDYKDIPGVTFQQKKIRVYPAAEAAAHLTGYVGEISAEELDKRKGQGYKAGDLIGKAGLEQVLEDRLRGKAGATVSVTDADGNEKAVLAETEPVPGETIELNVDSQLQQIVYNELKQEAASAAAIQPRTGEILALVSTPAYDPNAFVRGLSSAQYKAWNDDPRHPFLNRFTKGYAPGSAFKPITAAIGLDTKAIDPDEQKQIPGLTWTKDSSWGGYYVTRVHDVNPVNLLTSLVYSDNIYFAQAALQIGADAFAEEAAKFGIGEQVPILYPMSKSQLSNDGIKSEIQLADSGYGQGQVIMNSLHLALVYSALVNDGDMVYPSLSEEDKAGKPDMWKTGAMTPETAALLKDDLVKAVADPAGSGHGAYIPDASIAGKTGTAELKKSKDEEGQENGWFVGFDAKAPDLLLAVMIEDVRERGGSGYVTPKVKHIFEQAMQQP